jgi:hypothetical protein
MPSERSATRASRSTIEGHAVLTRVVSGGQTGADQGGLRAARAADIPTGGWAPRGWLVKSKDGHKDIAAPWLGPTFGLEECAELGYAARTRANARDSDGTLWFGDFNSPGGHTTLAACRLNKKPALIIIKGRTKPSDVATWIREKNVRILNVAGNHESTAPGIGLRVERFLMAVFRQLGARGLVEQVER